MTDHTTRTRFGRTLAAGALAAAAATGAAVPAAAATGGERTDNPGIVALTDERGNQLCSAVLIDAQWALTWEGPLHCGTATGATGDSHDRVGIDRRETPGRGPGASQAMLVHFDAPIQRVTPARLSDQAPKAGETLTVVAYNGPEGVNHLLSLGSSPITVEGASVWNSWYGAPTSMKLETGRDAGAPILRDGEVVGFTELVTETSTTAESVANVLDWIRATAT